MLVVRWAIIGAGSIARSRAFPALVAAGYPVVGVCRRDPGALAAWRDLVGGDALFAEPAAMLASTTPDAVYVASPPGLHERHAVAALEAGAHVLVEKPLALHHAQAGRIDEAARANVRVFMTALMMRHGTLHRAVRGLVADGRLGELRSIQLRMAFDYAATGEEWRLDPCLGGGGVFMDLGPHLLDLAEHLTGRRVTRIVGVASSLRTSRVEDSATVVAVLTGGVHATVATHFNLPEATTPSRIEVCGTLGTAVLTGSLGQVDAGELMVHSAEGVVVDRVEDPGDLYVRQLAAFADLVADPSQWPGHQRADVGLQHSIDAAYASFEEGV